MIVVKREEILEKMIRAGLTRVGLAKKSGITQGYISMIINGKRLILAPTAKKIVEALNCEFDDIFYIKLDGVK